LSTGDGTRGHALSMTALAALADGAGDVATLGPHPRAGEAEGGV